MKGMASPEAIRRLHEQIKGELKQEPIAPVTCDGIEKRVPELQNQLVVLEARLCNLKRSINWIQYRVFNYNKCIDFFNASWKKIQGFYISSMCSSWNNYVGFISGCNSFN